MTKDEFKKILLDEGFTCEKSGQYPSVVCEAKDVSRTAKKVKKIAKDSGYNSSFAIRRYREGMELMSKDGTVVMAPVADADTDMQGETVPMAEPIPMTAEAEDISA